MANEYLLLETMSSVYIKSPSASNSRNIERRTLDYLINNLDG